MFAPDSRLQLPHLLKPNVRGGVSTDLDSVISAIPWGDAFTLGSGIDAITGSVTVSAVVPFTPVQDTSKKSSEHYRFIQNDSDLHREIEASASGKYNIEGVTTSASASYLNKIKYSELSVTLVARYQSQYESYDEAPKYELTTNAKSLMSDPAKFRKAFGDYFVSGARRTSLFTAVYTCQTSTIDSMDKFKASFGGESPEIFSAEGSGSFLQAAKTHNVSISVDLFMEGYTGTPPNGPWTPAKIIDALAWFKKNEKGIKMAAKLQHYSYFDPNYPRTVDVAPEVFIDLRQLYTTVWGVRTGYRSLPASYQTRYNSEFIALDQGVVANQGILPRDADKRLQYRNQANQLLSKINEVFARLDFYFKVKAKVGTEPPKDQTTKEERDHRWSYGLSTYTKNSGVVIQMREFHHQESHGGILQVLEYSFATEALENTLIVGWEIISNWGDGTNGYWWKEQPQIIMTANPAVRIQSQKGRGFDWNLKIYYVNADDYQF
jgi:hypothetical protein